MGGHKLVIFQRVDGKWAWRFVAPNGQTIATDGGQGYESESECREMGFDVVTGERDGGLEVEVVPNGR